MVEAAGIEPASGSASAGDPTCVAFLLLIRRAGPRQARCLASLGGNLLCRMFPRPFRREARWSSSTSASRRSRGGRAARIRRRVRSLGSQLTCSRMINEANRGPRHASHASSTPVETMSPPQCRADDAGPGRHALRDDEDVFSHYATESCPLQDITIQQYRGQARMSLT